MEKESLLKFADYKNEDIPTVEKVTIEYSQVGDCCEDKDTIQTIVLTTENNGIAPFIRISIPEGHWSISGIEDLELIIKDFMTKVNYVEK